MVIYKVVKDGWFMTRKNSTLIKMIMLSIFVAIGVVISPILRVVGFCPTQHFVNIVCAVFLGPWYALLCATLIGIIRMSLMAIPPLALTGAVFGAFLSGRRSYWNWNNWIDSKRSCYEVFLRKEQFDVVFLHAIICACDFNGSDCSICIFKGYAKK